MEEALSNPKAPEDESLAEQIGGEKQQHLAYQSRELPLDEEEGATEAHVIFTSV